LGFTIQNPSSESSATSSASRGSDASSPTPARGLIIVPAFNEELGIADIVKRIAESVDQDVLFVNDGSADRTLDRLHEAGVRVLSHPVNLGYAETLLSGIEFALQHGYDYCVFLDADGQHDPKDIARLVQTLQNRKADVVIGSRFLDATGYKATVGRRTGMVVFARLASWITGSRITDPTSGFKVLSRRAMQAVSGKVFGDLHAELIVLLAVSDFVIVEESIQVSPRRHGSSMYGVLAAALYPLRTLLAMLIAWLEARLNRRNGEKP